MTSSTTSWRTVMPDSSATIWRQRRADRPDDAADLALVARVSEDKITLFRANTNSRVSLELREFAACFAGTAVLFALATQPARDPDSALARGQLFGFRWFIPELLKHKAVWRDVLLASLVIQLLALGTP